VVWDPLLKADPEGPSLIFHAAVRHVFSSYVLLSYVSLQHTQPQDGQSAWPCHAALADRSRRRVTLIDGTHLRLALSADISGNGLLKSNVNAGSTHALRHEDLATYGYLTQVSPSIFALVCPIRSRSDIAMRYSGWHGYFA
jgi:hypothetical protein